MKKKNEYRVKFIVLSVVCILTFFISLFIGRYRINIFGELSSTDITVMKNIRFPRIACAFLIGAALSAAGTAYQGMFRNPMVSPDLLGASTGAGFGAALAILLGGSYFAVTLSSFVFGLLAVFLAFLIAKKSKTHNTLALVLSGVVTGSLFSSGTSFIKLIADTENQLPSITYWLMGSLASVRPADLQFILIPVIPGVVLLILLSWRINILTVSEAEARSMGVNTAKLRAVVIILATLITSASVSISGMIGWVGLVIPHFCRMLFGNDNRRLIPASVLMGSTFLMIADNISRSISTSEIPIGILTSVIGAPLFIFLIVTGGSKNEY